ncbi:MAG: TlpA family protein disulfide reductase [Thermoanaerobaculia bacterium]
MRTLRAVVLAAIVASAAASFAAAENFPDLDLQGRDGEGIRLSQLRGNVVFLNFWATWCGPCRMELPLLQDLYNRYSDRNFTVLAINVDSDRARVEPFLKKNNLSLPTYFASPLDAATMTSNGIPTSIILKPSGEVEKAFVGYDPQIEKEWVAHIEKYLRKKRNEK